MADKPSEPVPLARIHFADTGAADLQDFAATLIDLARINATLRMLDPKSRSYAPGMLWSKNFYLNHPQTFIDRAERLYLSAARKASPMWVDLTLAGAGVVTAAAAVAQTVISALARRDGLRAQEREQRWRVYEVLHKHLGAEPENASRGAQHVERAMLAIGSAETPVARVELRPLPPRQGVPSVPEVSQTLFGGEEDDYDDR